MAKFSPTKDEVDSLQKYVKAGSDVEKLGQAEHFFLELMQIDNLAGRLSAWVFKREFDFKLADILVSIIYYWLDLIGMEWNGMKQNSLFFIYF